MSDWWKEAVIYQIYPRSFCDTSDNGIGDLNGIVQKIDYLSSLGVDAIWLSPFFKSPMKDMGYDVSNYKVVDPLFGSMQDFDELISIAHQNDIKVIIDQVLSHSSDQHKAFIKSRTNKDSKESDWYVWADPKEDGSPPNNWLSVFGGSAWEWEPEREQYYLHNFLSSQPDFNFHNEEVQDYVLRIVKFWLEKGVDGFRLDTVNYYFHDQKVER
jgi:alpha-glucosidase